jgi:hypothetical protein
MGTIYSFRGWVMGFSIWAVFELMMGTTRTLSSLALALDCVLCVVCCVLCVVCCVLCVVSMTYLEYKESPQCFCPWVILVDDKVHKSIPHPLERGKEIYWQSRITCTASGAGLWCSGYGIGEAWTCDDGLESWIWRGIDWCSGLPGQGIRRGGP